jgi:hypothetical protein
MEKIDEDGVNRQAENNHTDENGEAEYPSLQSHKNDIIQDNLEKIDQKQIKDDDAFEQKLDLSSEEEKPEPIWTYGGPKRSSRFKLMVESSLKESPKLPLEKKNEHEPDKNGIIKLENVLPPPILESPPLVAMDWLARSVAVEQCQFKRPAAPVVDNPNFESLWITKLEEFARCDRLPVDMDDNRTEAAASHQFDAPLGSTKNIEITDNTIREEITKEDAKTEPDLEETMILDSSDEEATAQSIENTVEFKEQVVQNPSIVHPQRSSNLFRIKQKAFPEKPQQNFFRPNNYKSGLNLAKQ